jgi:hypothetical protein
MYRYDVVSVTRIGLKDFGSPVTALTRVPPGTGFSPGDAEGVVAV